MSKLTFEQAKQLVAEKKGFESWDEFIQILITAATAPKVISLKWAMSEVERASDQVAELLAQNWSNDAVKEVKKNLIPAGLFTSDTGGYYHATDVIESIPLPYPEIER